MPENSAEGLGSRGERDRERQRETEADRAAEVIFMRIHPKSWSIFPLKVVASLLGGPCKGAIGA